MIPPEIYQCSSELQSPSCVQQSQSGLKSLTHKLSLNSELKRENLWEALKIKIETNEQAKVSKQEVVSGSKKKPNRL